MKPFRSRLTLILLLLVGISVLAAGLTMAKVFRDSHISSLEDYMGREIDLLEDLLELPPAPAAGEALPSVFEEEAKRLGSLTDSRVTFVARDGRVIGDSLGNTASMDNHLNREEIRTSVSGTPGHAVRYSDTLGRDMLYVAAPIVSSGGFDGYLRLSMSLDIVGEGLQRGWIIMGSALAILFLIAAVVSYRLAGGLTRPIEHIMDTANRISKLDYDARVGPMRQDEIGQLGASIDNMADSLQAQMHTIRDNESLLQNVLDNMTGGILMVNQDEKIGLVNRQAERMLGIRADRVVGRRYVELKRFYELTRFIEEGLQRKCRMHDELTLFVPEERLISLDGVPMTVLEESYHGMLFLFQDVSDIRRLERMRSEFVANVSHELKTPVAAVQGFAETLLAGGVKDEETARSFLKIIYDEGDRLNRLIGDILDLSKIESRRIQLDYAPVHVLTLFQSVSRVLEGAAEQKRIEIRLNVPEELFIEADEDRLRQIFLNLVGNGVSYTPDGGRIVIKAEEFTDERYDDERIRFSVSDNGIGIPKKDLPRIFERFYRVDKARSRSSGGTGLGLSIVKHLVELHRGTISVESELGVGSTFIVELPILQENP
ncbi:two-component system histidine kinase PnpS [Saccharibacillus alkalitolerans]|uniref:histidine kinase n=1 Tax=Saccharibacillus alkalitolerans TaxID=2705290 RepID=A0ABX0F9A5_9BACL|nr:ATP-binding protein [Saccharibacillus alkalitolerans]NGZ75806.1 cell wall metabolism sensor histidine kinase WalK [Saccharibacillus alkalitolerans]